jgi:hypothetical protein
MVFKKNLAVASFEKCHILMFRPGQLLSGQPHASIVPGRATASQMLPGRSGLEESVCHCAKCQVLCSY